MDKWEGTDRSDGAEAYLLDCLKAFRGGKPAPERPAELVAVSARLDRKVRRLGELVRQESRNRRHVRGARAVLNDPDAVPIPGYTLTEVVGRGRFGVVFRAEDRRWRGRLVAVKVLYDEIPNSFVDDDRWDRVFGEARQTSILDHPNIVRCHDHGMIPFGSHRRAFLVFELVDGVTLHQDTRAWFGRLSSALAPTVADRRGRQIHVARLLAEVARAANAVHVGRPKLGLAGAIHGDITPMNILIDSEGKPRLTDFGLAIPRGAFTARGGTPGFFAPEMASMGEPIGPEADVYSIGATLHYCLTGTVPTPPDEVATPVLDVGLHPDLDAIRRKALHPDPAWRYRRAGDLADDLGRFVRGEAVLARPIPFRVKLLRSCRAYPWRWASGGLVLVGLGLLLGSIAESYGRGQRIERLNQALDVSLPMVDLADPEAVGTSDLPIESRRLIAARLLPYLNQVALVRGVDARTNAALAQALISRARLLHVLGTPADDAAAIADLERAGTILGAQPDDLERDLARAGIAVSLASILGPRREFDRGLAAVDPIVTQLQTRIEQGLTSPPVRYRLALALNSRGNFRRGMAIEGLVKEKLDEAAAVALLNRSRADLFRSIELLGGLCDADPNEPRYVEWLARIKSNLGLLLLNLASVRPEEMPQALESLRDAMSRAESLALRMPRSYRAQDALVATRINLGDGLRAIGQPDQAEAVYRQTVVDYDTLNDRLPQFREFAWGQASARRQVGLALSEQGRKRDAIAALQDALRRYDRLVAMYPDVAEIATERSELAEQIKGYE